MAAKEDLIHDINIVTTLSSQQDMSVPANARRYLQYYEQRRTFKTEIGHHYLERLKQVSGGLNPDKCFVCKKNRAYDGILCEACMQKYTRGAGHFYNESDQDVFSTLDSIFENSNEYPYQKNAEVEMDEKAVIAQRLKPYKELQYCTCLECGYSGLMGVIRYKNGIIKRIVIPLIVCFIVGGFMRSFIGGFIAGIIVTVIVNLLLGNHKRVLFCPNCQKTIVQR